jgi:hypothetical protein
MTAIAHVTFDLRGETTNGIALDGVMNDNVRSSRNEYLLKRGTDPT